MKAPNWRLPTALALAAATCLPAARAADLITFDAPALANLYGGFEEFPLGDYRGYFQSDGGLIGMADELPEGVAPTGNNTPFATALNNGVVSIFRADGASFDLVSFDFAFVPHPNAPPPLFPMVLVIYGGLDTSGAWAVDQTLTGQPFTRVDDPAQLTSFRNVASLTFTMCSLDPETNEVCTFTLGSSGQFALDNLVLQSPIPEPTTTLLWCAGLAALGARRWLPHRTATCMTPASI